MSSEGASGTDQPRCPRCGRFCGVSPKYAGSVGQVLSESCLSCGLNVPNCSAEDGSCYGCKNTATHRGSTAPNKRGRLWCEGHAPEGAEPLPYVTDQEADA